MEVMHTVTEWENAKPAHIIYTEIKLNDSGFVTQVKGKVPFVKMVREKGEKLYQSHQRSVYWNAAGECFSGARALRRRDNDIRFSI